MEKPVYLHKLGERLARRLSIRIDSAARSLDVERAPIRSKPKANAAMLTPSILKTIPIQTGEI